MFWSSSLSDRLPRQGYLFHIRQRAPGKYISGSMCTRGRVSAVVLMPDLCGHRAAWLCAMCHGSRGVVSRSHAPVQALAWERFGDLSVAARKRSIAKAGRCPCLQVVGVARAKLARRLPHAAPRAVRLRLGVRRCASQLRRWQARPPKELHRASALRAARAHRSTGPASAPAQPGPRREKQQQNKTKHIEGVNVGVGQLRASSFKLPSA